MKVTNNYNLPQGFVKASSTERHNQKGCLSATTLLQGVKQIILSERHWDEIAVDVSENVWAIFGTAVHALLEHEGETDFTEQSLKSEVNGVTITGKIDNYDMNNCVITDYKTASVWKCIYKDFDDWRKQGLIYAWLCNQNGLPVNKCRFIALLKDHSKTEAKRDRDYPQSPVFIYEFNVTEQNIKEIESFIISVLSDYLAGEKLKDSDIPACSAEQRWAKPDTWAVMKEGRKSAVKVCNSERESSELLSTLDNKHSIEYRKGVSRKCQDYCDCCEFCNFYKEVVIGK